MNEMNVINLRCQIIYMFSCVDTKHAECRYLDSFMGVTVNHSFLETSYFSTLLVGIKLFVFSTKKWFGLDKQDEVRPPKT